MGHPRKPAVSMARSGTTRPHGIVGSGRGRLGSGPSIIGSSLRPRSLRRTVSGLASDATQSLRRTAAPAVRGGVALLLSVSLAACGDGAGLVVPTPPADRSSAATAPTVAPTALPSEKIGRAHV